MSLERNDEDPLIGAAGFVFQTSVRAKRSKNPARTTGKVMQRLAKRRIAAVVGRRPEVMVKVTGSARGRKHIGEHLAYISRNGKLMAEKSDGELVMGGASVAELADEWWAMRGDMRQSNARDTYNLVFSMPAGTDPEQLRDAAREFARQEFGGKHDYVFVLHTKETDPSKKKAEQPHVHLSVRTLGLHGQCLDPKKADLQAWREGFAAALRRRGIQAEATPRRARGVVQKGTKQALRHMGKRSRVNSWKVEHALKALQKGAEPDTAQPWKAAIEQRQTNIRNSWRVIATALDDQGEPGLAIQVRAFVDSMPSLRTRQEALVQQAIEATRSNEQSELLKRSQTALLPDSGHDQGRKRR